ncbi:MAG TPA: transcription elongation factor GreA [Chloroflexi bacterium]|nr:transcription elongation factor GreA [Chloroflexota bacterium]
MTKTYLTEAGYEKLQADLDHLRTVRRQEVAERLHEAMADGDAGIDNDAEVDAAKNEQAFVEGRIRELEMILSSARIIDESRVLDTVEVGAKVEIQEDGTPVERYTIVGAAEADPTNGFVSNESPLGRALMGHKAGDVVTVKAPNGEFTVTLLKVE